MNFLKTNISNLSITKIVLSHFKHALKIPWILGFMLLVTILNAQRVVDPGDDLNSIIENSNGGTIILNEGTYDPLLISGKEFSVNNPLILKAAEGAEVTIDREGNWEYKNPNTGTYDAAVFTQCSYIAIDGINFNGGHRGVTVHRSDHVIFRNCKFQQALEAGVKVEDNSEYIDFRECIFSNSGQGNPDDYKYPWFGEGLYIGRGGYGGDNARFFPDATKYIWVEGCEFYNTGKAEAINVKGEVFSCTIRNNNIYDITLNDAEDLVHRQTNEGAISLDHTSTVNGNKYREGVPRENWVENNKITTVRTGQTTVRPNGETPTPRIAGIYSAGTGNNIVRNEVSDVTNNFPDYPAVDIRFNNFRGDNIPNNVYRNDIEDNDYRNLAIERNPGTNPNRAQSWYPIITMLGDVDCDGDVDAVDALALMQYTVDQRRESSTCPLQDSAEEIYIANGDVNNSGRADAADALLILQCAVGISNVFCENANARNGASTEGLLNTNKRLKVYPSLFDDFITVQYKNEITTSANKMIYVTSINSQVVQQIEIPNQANWSTVIPTTDFAPGLFVVTMIDGEHKEVFKLVKN